MKLNKDLVKAFKKSYKDIIELYLFWIVLFCITFFKTNIIINLLTATSLFTYFLVIPYIIYLMIKRNKLIISEFFIFIVIYISLSLLLSYYLAIIGLHIRYHVVVLPLIILLGVLFWKFDEIVN
jgi:hypothetical protein